MVEVIKFGASWCGPCKTLTPRLENLSKDYDKIKFVKIDVEENQDLAIELGIRSVPTVIIYDGENAVDRTAGNQPLETYTKVLNTL